MSEFAMALANNTKLKIFFIVNIRGVTSISHDALSRLLCDTSTILNTFNSNHTLESSGFVLREDFSALQRITMRIVSTELHASKSSILISVEMTLIHKSSLT